MRSILLMAFLGLFSADSFALDQKALEDKIMALRAKEAAGESIKEDVAKLSEEVTKESQSLVVTHTADVSIVGKDGKVLFTLKGAPKTTVLANSEVHNDAAAQAVSKDPKAKVVHNLEEGAATLGGGKKSAAPAADPAATAPAPAPASTSSGGFGSMISSAIGAAVDIGTSVVGGLFSGILGGAL